MRNVQKLTLTSALALALTFFGCDNSGVDCGDDCGGGRINYDAYVTYSGETYRTVVIGSQTWFARNLNYYVEGSKCYDNDNYNCNRYGRLYNWVTAMALSNGCNDSECACLINAKHQGICPSGWHIPSENEWDVLMDYVGSSSTAGLRLKATRGWNDGGNGRDIYGFAALPGGVGVSDGNFYATGNDGVWWSANEYNDTGAYGRFISYWSNSAFNYSNYKTHLFSVRCVRD